jgi:hypothetical protein
MASIRARGRLWLRRYLGNHGPLISICSFLFAYPTLQQERDRAHTCNLRHMCHFTFVAMILSLTLNAVNSCLRIDRQLAIGFIVTLAHNDSGARFRAPFIGESVSWLQRTRGIQRILSRGMVGGLILSTEVVESCIEQPAQRHHVRQLQDVLVHTVSNVWSNCWLLADASKSGRSARFGGRRNVVAADVAMARS